MTYLMDENIHCLGIVAVMNYKSPFDNDWMYWSKNNNKQYGGVKAKILT